jgi:hypothetical protein
MNPRAQTQTNILRCGTATIIVRCGTDTTEDFTVHENLITAASKFFKAALSHDWKEKFDRLIKLPDILPDDFRLYVRWLYTNSLFPSARADIDTINIMSQAGLGQFQPREDELVSDQWPELFAIGSYLESPAFLDGHD